MTKTMLTQKRVNKYYKKEMEDYLIYLKLADKLGSKTKFKKLAEMEKKHAKFWADIAKSRGYELKSKPSNIRISMFLLFAKISPIWTAKVLELLENKTVKEYYKAYKSGELSTTEKKQLKEIIEDEIFHEHEMIESKKERRFVEHIRDVFLGMNDGLVEILSALAGLVSLYPNNPLLIGITGLIVGLSGTLSMGVGTYISVKNQKDIKEKTNFEYKISKDLNIKTDASYEEITENPLKAGYLTGIFYIVGTALVVYPFFLGITPHIAIIISALTAVITWIIAGFIVAISSGISIKGKILEMLITGLGAATITYSFGYIINLLTGGVV